MESEKGHLATAHSALINDLRQIIDSARQRVAVTVNAELTMMYWHIGERINREVLGNQRAEYGKQIVSTVATQLQSLYGTKGFELRNIRRMMQFAQKISSEQIVSQLATQLTWSHIIEVLPIKDPLAVEFYLTMSSSNRWGRNRLRKEIDGMLFERTAIAQKPDELIKQELAELRDDNKMSPDLVFKSPYFLEFTGLKGCYSEKSLEDSLVVHLEQFILELGNGFTFVERQKRMIIDGEDFYLDLLFFHRKLHRLIAIDLKLGRFKAQYKRREEQGTKRENTRSLQDDDKEIRGTERASSREVRKDFEGSRKYQEISHGNDESIKSNGSSSRENRQTELEGQSKTICNSNGNNARSNIDNSRSIPVNKPNKVRAWDMER